MMLMDYEVLTDEQWQAMPARQKVSSREESDRKWAPIIEMLKEGKVVSIPAETNRELLSTRLQVTRRCNKEGFKVEARWNDTHVAFLRIDRVVEENPTGRRKRGGA